MGRQCAEAVLIKNSDPSKLINNKKEYHQPGDVETKYQKNENQEFKIKNIQNKRKTTESVHKEMSYKCDKCDFDTPEKENLKKHYESVHREKHYTCDECDFNATDKELLKRHTKSTHNETQNENAPNIIEFIKRMRSENEKNKLSNKKK